MKNSVFKVLNKVFVNKCVLCHNVAEGALCDICKQKIKPIQYSLCYKCGKPHYACVCGKKDGFDRCISAFSYETKGVSRLVYKLKTTGNRYVTEFLADSMAEAVKREYKSVTFSAVTFVPAYSFKTNKKGFDHARLVAEIIAEKLNLKLVNSGIIRKRFKNQKYLKGNKRIENAKNSYIIKKKVKSLSGNILLVDDVMTTGSTFSVCSRLLKNTGAEAVYCVSAATSFKKGK